MCGRYVAKSQPDEIARYFGAAMTETLVEAPPEANFNVAPTSEVMIVLEREHTRCVDLARWGLVPSWAKDRSIGARMINARAETLASKPAFKRAFQRKRCIVPADGFYEWKVIAGQKRKQPVYIHRADGDHFAFAGLWELWRNPEAPDDAPLRTCTIITGPANAKIAPVHDRMPVMLAPDAWATWLDHDNHDTDALRALFVPAPASLIEIHAVSTAVNSVRNKSPELIDPVPSEVPLDA